MLMAKKFIPHSIIIEINYDIMIFLSIIEIDQYIETKYTINK
jgi:hypothetical protein